MKIEKSDRLKALPPYLFAEIDRKKEEVRARGVDIIDLGVGDPDLPTPDHIIKAAQAAVAKPEFHKYPSYSGMGAFNESAARFYEKRFGVKADPKTQVITLIGSKEGVAHIPLALVNPGDAVLVPSPGYPVYAIGSQFAGGEVHYMDLLDKNHFLPDFSAIPEDVLAKAKLMFLNYPNNPTAACADMAFFDKVVAFAEKHEIIVCHDNAYSEMGYNGYQAPSFLEADGAFDVGMEFNSLSKTYNMTGWRIGFAIGNAQVIGALGQVKSNIDSGAFDAIQMAGIEALDGNQQCVADMQKIYEERRDILVTALRDMGIDAFSPQATFYVWMRTPKGQTSAGFAGKLLTEAGVVATPGNGFGDAGEGYVRMALTVDKDRLAEAVERIRKMEL